MLYTSPIHPIPSIHSTYSINLENLRTISTSFCKLQRCEGPLLRDQNEKYYLLILAVPQSSNNDLFGILICCLFIGLTGFLQTESQERIPNGRLLLCRRCSIFSEVPQKRQHSFPRLDYLHSLTLSIDASATKFCSMEDHQCGG